MIPGIHPNLSLETNKSSSQSYNRGSQDSDYIEVHDPSDEGDFNYVKEPDVTEEVGRAKHALSPNQTSYPNTSTSEEYSSPLFSISTNSHQGARGAVITREGNIARSEPP